MPGEARSKFAAMRHDDEHGVFFAAQFQKQRSDRLGRVPIEITGWFVGQQQWGPVNKRPADGDALPFASGKLRRPVRDSLAKPHPVE